MSSTDYSSDDSSDRSYDEPIRRRFCPYRTPRFNGHECSRYLDCPAHTINRPAGDEDEDEDDDEDETEDEDEDEDLEDPHHHDEDDEDDDGARYGDEEQQDRSPHGQSVLSSRGGEPPGRQVDVDALGRDVHSDALRGGGDDVIDLTSSSPPPQRQDESGVAGPSRTSGQVERQSQARGKQVEVIDLTEDSPEPVPLASGSRTGLDGPNDGERALPTIPFPASGSSSSATRGVAVSPSAQRRPATPPSPPPPIRRRTSANNFGTAPRPGMMQAPTPSGSRRPSELVLPRWQPDAEVTFCPICRTQFNFLIRKHHCRKCGRVVCARCSPHRITIPYQYIVQPPGTPRPGAQRYPASLISGEGGHADFSSLGGGEKVRLCNPCVPDPNINPPDSQSSPPSIRGHGRSQSSVGSGGAYGSNNTGPPQPGSYFDAYVRNRSATMLPSASRQTPSGRFYQPTQGRIMSGTPPSNYPHAHAGSPFAAFRPPRLRSAYEGGQASSSSSAAAQRRPLPPDPPQLAEEDECPICHRELPPRSLANFEEIREAHINTCITSHSTYGGLSNGEDSRPRRTGMFPYVATEKDCVDSAECTICLEEFEVGVPMARLECLCRFHRDCISRWFAKNPGRCPVHSHDGHGF